MMFAWLQYESSAKSVGNGWDGYGMDEYTVLIMGIFRITQINSVCVSSLVEMMILKNSRESRNSQR